MASKQANVDFVLEQLTEAGNCSARKMFGEYAIYRGDKIVALFCDDQLFIKPTDAGKAFIGKVTEAPPYPGAKSWFLITGDRCEDGEWLSELVQRTWNELPAPKPKAPKVAKKQAKSGARAKTSSARKTSSAKKRAPKIITRGRAKASRKR
jgi:TfoX/Sxy family transcriptional regulator of competence genes